MNSPSLQRRARPLLGTLVDIGCDDECAFDAAFDAVQRVHRCMSRFDRWSDIGRFNDAAAGACIEVDPWTAEVLAAAQALRDASGGLFDVSLGSGVDDWQSTGRALFKRSAAVRLDLGGIAKGFALDRAVEALQAAGACKGWVNAGGDLRVFGALELPIALRDEAHGGVRPFGRLSEGAFATSRLSGAHVSVLAPTGLVADALTKLVALSGRCDHPLLTQHGASAWRH
jgi:thiamine biosynthesis lipoprotein